jgi:2-oxoglutarate ferredoxin oxidoreductase subunit alpha
VHADPKGVLTGIHFIDGDHALRRGPGGVRFVAVNHHAVHGGREASPADQVGGVFIQLEDELASSIAIQGAAWGGKKVMSVTSGPGLSLMMEHIGFAAITETPSVWVDVQRGGPSTGLPTLPAQQDMMGQGSRDYEIIAFSSPQECFDLMITVQLGRDVPL